MTERRKPTDVELAASLADSQSVGRILAATEHARTANRRKPVPPARKEPTMTRHDLARAYSRMPIPPPTAADHRAAAHFLEGRHGGALPPPDNPLDDERAAWAAEHPFGDGFDKRGRPLQSTQSPVANRAALEQYERARESGFTDEASQRARQRIRAQFDEDGNQRPGPPIVPSTAIGQPRNDAAIRRARENIAQHLAEQMAPYLRGHRQG